MASLPPVGGGTGGVVGVCVGLGTDVEVGSVSPVGGGPPGVPASPLLGLGVAVASGAGEVVTSLGSKWLGLAGVAVQARATVIRAPSKSGIAISFVDLKVVCSSRF